MYYNIIIRCEVVRWNTQIYSKETCLFKVTNIKQSKIINSYIKVLQKLKVRSLSRQRVWSKGCFLFPSQGFETYSRCQRFWSQSGLRRLRIWLAASDDLIWSEPLLFGPSRNSTRNSCGRGVWRQRGRCESQTTWGCGIRRKLRGTKTSLQRNRSGRREVVVVGS